jgi:hypothetical protein
LKAEAVAPETGYHTQQGQAATRMAEPLGIREAPDVVLLFAFGLALTASRRVLVWAIDAAGKVVAWTDSLRPLR